MIQTEQVPDTLALMFSHDYDDANKAADELKIWQNSISYERAVGLDVGRRGGDEKCTRRRNAEKSYIETEMPEYSLWLELVEDCNLDCEFCYNPWRPINSSMRTRRHLTKFEYVDIVSTIISSIQINHVTLSGGEPLMFPNLNEIIILIRKSGCDSIGMTTNGRSLTRGRLNTLCNAGLTQITIPLHSHCPDMHDTLAAGNSWKSAVRALAFGIERGIAVTLSSVVTTKNLCDIPKVADIVGQLGIRSWILNCMHTTGQGADRDDLSVSAGAFAELVSSVRTTLDERAQVTVGSPPVGRDSRRDDSVDRLVLSPYGDIKLCNQSHHGVLRVLDSPIEFRSFLSALRNHSYSEYVARVDHCLCRATF